MKGVILDAFLDFVRSECGLVRTETLIQSLELPSGGVYAGVGNYPAAELGTLVAAHAAQSGSTRAEVLGRFGRWLLPKLMGMYTASMPPVSSVFDLLRVLDGVIHVEVRKLYPQSELPHFQTRDLPDGRLWVRYQSQRRLEDFAEGLILGAAAHFGEDVAIERIPEGDATVFILSRREEA